MRIKLQKVGKIYIHLEVENNNCYKAEIISFEHISGKIFYLRKNDGDCQIDSNEIDLGTNDSEYIFINTNEDKRNTQYYCFVELLKQFKSNNTPQKEDNTNIFEIEI